MSPLSHVVIRSSYNIGELISYFGVNMPPISIDFPTFNGGELRIVGNTLEGSEAFSRYF